jgi:hypothetical protein
MPEKSIFIHIQKTAGTTLKKVVLNRAGETACAAVYDEERWPMELNDALNNPDKTWIFGHFPFVESLEKYPARRYTLLRNPHDRLLSHYFHVLRSTKAKHQLWKNEFSDLDGFLRMPRMQNVQTKFLAGLAEDDAPPGEEHFQRALHRLRTSFDLVGVQERMRPFLIALAEQQGWNNLVFESFNRGDSNAHYNSLKTEHRAALEAASGYDQILYQEAHKHFERSWQKIPARRRKWLAQVMRNQVHGWTNRLASFHPQKT